MFHDALCLKFQELHRSSDPFETVRVQYKNSGSYPQEYAYQVAIQDDAILIEDELQLLFRGLKQELLTADFQEVIFHVQEQIEKKIASFDTATAEQMLCQLNEYSKHFDLAQFLEAFSLKVIKTQTFISFWQGYEFDAFNHYSVVQVIDIPTVYTLTLSDQEKNVIGHIITEMGTKSLFSLLKKRTEMLKLGDQIRNVPPLDFLGYIFSNPELKKHMYSIKKSHFKWKNIVDEIGNNMNIEMRNHEQFRTKVEAFSRLLHVDSNTLIMKAHEKDWAGFISVLM
jgi:hypothetical protein